MGKVKRAIVQDGVLWTEGSEINVSAAIQVNSTKWHDWLINHKKFRFKGTAGHFSARCEIRQGSVYWYAYRRRDGKLHKAYLGKSEDITLTQLEQVAADLAGTTLLKQLAFPTNSHSEPLKKSRITNSFPALTKIRPPILPPNLITRPRLNQKINSQVTIIYAPGGFGKSTFLNDWQQQGDTPIAWVALDADDNQLLKFWPTIIMALQAVVPALGKNLLPYLQVASPINPSEIVNRLTNEIVRATEESTHIGLVLDDYHHIHHSDVHSSIQTWLEHLPPTLQLIISSRTRPPIALGRLRAQGLVTELEMEDLRFTLEEGINFLQRRVSDPPLAYGDMETLVKRTGGWVAGLMLAVSALNKQQDRRHFLDSFNGAHIFLREYFLESVLHQQPEAIQEFLLKTSILKQLTGSLCDALTGRSDGAQMLDLLWQENLFIVRLEESDWYHYHDLFAEMLRNQLRIGFPDQIAVLHRRAAAWYRQQNVSADAVRHLLAIEDWEESASLIEDVVLNELAEYGEDSRLLRWIQQLPESVFQHHKTLLFVYLRLAKLALQPAEVERFLQRLENKLEGKADDKMTLAEIEVLDEIRMIRQRKMAGDTMISPSENTDPRWQLLDSLWIVEANYMPKHDDIGKRLYEIYEQAQAEENLFVVLISGADCGNRAFLHGHFREGERIIYQVLQYALTQRSKLPEPASIALVNLSRIHLERNELSQAEALLQQAAAVDPNPTSSNMLINIAILRAKLQAAAGDDQAAKSTIQAARTLQAQRPSGVWRDQDLAAYEAMFCIPLKNWGEVKRLLNEIDEEDHPLSNLVQAQMLLEQQQAAAAEEILSRLITQNPAGLPTEPLMYTRILHIQALFAQHKMKQARQLLSEAIRQTAPERFIRPFLKHNLEFVSLLTLTLQTENLPFEAQEFTREILQIIEYDGEMQNLWTQEKLDSLATAATVTQREIDVLQLVSDGFSNREIGLQLCISPGTVKTHLANIYKKLDVNNRVQAVAEAQLLKLV